jgi:hypothetical protein
MGAIKEHAGNSVSTFVKSKGFLNDLAARNNDDNYHLKPYCLQPTPLYEGINRIPRQASIKTAKRVTASESYQ